MKEYQKSYLVLWQSVSEAIEAIEQLNYGIAKELLLKGQRKAEEAFICWEEENKTQK